MAIDLPPKIFKPAIIRPAEPRLLLPGYLPADRKLRRAAIREILDKRLITRNDVANALVSVYKIAPHLALILIPTYLLEAGMFEEPGNDAYTIYLLHCDGSDASTTFTDASSSAKGNASAVGNAQVDTAQSKFGGASLLLDGSGDYLEENDHDDWTPGTGDYTWDFWVRFNSLASTQTFLSHFDSGVADGRGWHITWTTATNLRFTYSNDGASSTDKDYSWSPSTGTWYHVAVVRHGTSVRAFINGTEIGTALTLSAGYSMFNSVTTLKIGQVASVQYFNGWMDEIRLTKGKARWLGNFIPPTRAYS